MIAPSKITVLIEGKDQTESARLIKYDEKYHAAEYESGDGSRFYVDMDYLYQLGNQPAKIPLDVIRQLSNMRQKLSEAQSYLDNQNKKSNLVLPPGYGN
jgi:hypothetical protein